MPARNRSTATTASARRRTPRPDAPAGARGHQRERAAHEDDPGEHGRRPDRLEAIAVGRRVGQPVPTEHWSACPRVAARSPRGQRDDDRHHEQRTGHGEQHGPARRPARASSSRPQPASRARRASRGTRRAGGCRCVPPGCGRRCPAAADAERNRQQEQREQATPSAGAWAADQRGRGERERQRAEVERALLGERLHRGVGRAAPVVVAARSRAGTSWAARCRRSPGGRRRRWSASAAPGTGSAWTAASAVPPTTPSANPTTGLRTRAELPRAAARPAAGRRRRRWRPAGGSSTRGGRRRTAARPPPRGRPRAAPRARGSAPRAGAARAGAPRPRLRPGDPDDEVQAEPVDQAGEERPGVAHRERARQQERAECRREHLEHRDHAERPPERQQVGRQAERREPRRLRVGEEGPPERRRWDSRAGATAAARGCARARAGTARPSRSARSSSRTAARRPGAAAAHGAAVQRKSEALSVRPGRSAGAYSATASSAYRRAAAAVGLDLMRGAAPARLASAAARRARPPRAPRARAPPCAGTARTRR